MCEMSKWGGGGAQIRDLWCYPAHVFLLIGVLSNLLRVVWGSKVRNLRHYAKSKTMFFQVISLTPPYKFNNLLSRLMRLPASMRCRTTSGKNCREALKVTSVNRSHMTHYCQEEVIIVLAPVWFSSCPQEFHWQMGWMGRKMATVQGQWERPPETLCFLLKSLQWHPHFSKWTRFKSWPEICQITVPPFQFSKRVHRRLVTWTFVFCDRSSAPEKEMTWLNERIREHFGLPLTCQQILCITGTRFKRPKQYFGPFVLSDGYVFRQ